MVFKRANISIFLTALAAGLGYGGWAAYANYEHGFSAWSKAASIQGVLAFFSTLIITHVAHKIYLQYGCKIRGILAGFSMSFIIMLAIPLAVHKLAGTPDVLQTILPGLIWGSIYLIGFLLSLEIKNRNAARDQASL